MMDSWEWVLERSNVTFSSTSSNYWRHFKQLYTLVRGQYLGLNVDLNVNRTVKRHHDSYLVRRFALRAPNIEDKPVFGASDLLARLTSNVVSDAKVFTLESHHIGLHWPAVLSSLHRQDDGVISGDPEC